MVIKIIECIEKDDPSEETLRLTKRWKEITKPGDYRFTQGQWKKYNPSRALRAEQKRIEVELWQKRNKLLWKHMDNNSREAEEELERKRKFHRVIEKIRAKPKRDETGTSSSTQQPQEQDEIKTMSSDSDQTIAEPAINFKRYLGQPVYDIFKWERLVECNITKNGTLKKPFVKSNKISQPI